MTDPARRNNDLAAIHVMAKQLGMDTHDKNPDSEYRSMLWTLARTRSSGDLDYTGLARVKAHLQQLLRQRGVKVPRARRQPQPGRPAPALHVERQIHKIDKMLADAGLTRDYLEHAGEGKATSMLKRITGVDRLQFCRADQLRNVIAALTYQANRIKVRAARAAAEGRQR